jgi:ABC-2 type transport system ATP-binding protein
VTDAVASAGVTKRIGKTAVIDGIDFAMPSGQMWSVIGPRGAGRTTLIRLIAGLTRPDAGTVHVFGRDTVRAAEAVQAIIGYVPQGVGSYDTLTVGENLELHAELRGVAPDIWRNRSRDILGLTGLGDQTGERAAALSPAARRRLALACALAAMPRLLLLDEFTAGLDPASRGEMLDVLRRLATEEKISILMSTTYADEAERCDGVVFLNDGRLIACGSPRDLVSTAARRTRTVVVTADDRHAAAARLREQDGVIDVEVYRTRLKVIVDDADRAVPPHVAATSSDAIAPRLDDAFVCLLNDRGVPMLAPPVLQPPDQRRPGSAPPALEVRGLAVRQHGRSFVQDIDLTVAHGEIVGLIGPDGPGKELLIRLLCGLEGPTAGAIAIGGIGLASDRRRALARLAHIDSAASPYPDLTPVQILQFFASACFPSRAASDDRIRALLAELGLEQAAATHSGSLPTALQWRVALAAALVREPEFMLLGAPRAHLDPLTRRLVWADIGAVAAAGVGVLVASQATEDAQRCDRALSFDSESIAVLSVPAESIPEAVSREPAAPVLATLAALFSRPHQGGSAE